MMAGKIPPVHVLSFDLGTTAVKAAVVAVASQPTVPSEADAGAPSTEPQWMRPSIQICAAVSVDTHAYQLTDNPDFSEQDPKLIFKAVNDCCEKLGSHWLSQCKRMTFSDQMHGCVSVVDKGDELVWGPLITWEDKRCHQDFLAELNTVANTFELPSVSSGYGIPTLCWQARDTTTKDMKHAEGHKTSKIPISDATSIGTIGSVLAAQISNCAASYCCMDATDGCSWGFATSSHSSFHPEAIKRVLLELSHIASTPFIPSGSVLGTLDALKCERMGLPALTNVGRISAGEGYCVDGHPVLVHGCVGDHPAAVLGALALAGCLNCLENTFVINIGTSAQITAIVSDATRFTTKEFATKCEIRPFVLPGMKLLVGAAMNGGNVLEWFAKSLSETFALKQPSSTMADVYNILEDAAETVLHDSDAVTVTASGTLTINGWSISPFLHRERYHTDVNPQFSIHGIGPKGFSAGELYCAAVAGVLQNLFDFMPEAMWRCCDRIVFTGGVFHHSKTARELAAAIINRVHKTPACKGAELTFLSREQAANAGTVGSALLATITHSE